MNEISNIIDLIVNDGELHGITPVIILEFAVKSSNLLSREDATFWKTKKRFFMSDPILLAAYLKPID